MIIKIASKCHQKDILGHIYFGKADNDARRVVSHVHNIVIRFVPNRPRTGRPRPLNNYQPL